MWYQGSFKVKSLGEKFRKKHHLETEIVTGKGSGSSFPKPCHKHFLLLEKPLVPKGERG